MILKSCSLSQAHNKFCCPISTLTTIAFGTQSEIKLELQLQIRRIAANIKGVISVWIGHTCEPWRQEVYLTHEEIFLATKFSSAHIPFIIRQAFNRVFGDPMAISKEQARLRMHTTLHHNPTRNHLTISAMQIPDEDGSLITHVPPDSCVSIPTPYTLGGKKSTVYGVAPQLVPIEPIDRDQNLLDLTPIYFGEWVQYYPLQMSLCCNASIAWSDASVGLVCLKCRKVVHGRSS